jgi:predicted RNase H-like HicB family nuclease
MGNRYPFIIEWSEEDNEYIATCPAFPGLSAFGKTEEEALREGKVALAGFIETCEANNVALPEPAVKGAFSGKFQLRLSKSLHRVAVQMAELEEVSLNTYIADAVRARVSGEQVAKPVIEEMRRQFAATRTEVASVMTVQPIERYTKTTRETVCIEQTVSHPSNKERRRDN